MVLNFYSASA